MSLWTELTIISYGIGFKYGGNEGDGCDGEAVPSSCQLKSSIFIFASRSWPSVTATTRFASLRLCLKLETSHLIQAFCCCVFRSSVRSVLNSSVDMDDRSMDRK